MTTTKPDEHKETERRKNEIQTALIGKQVMHTLGRPDGLHELKVCRLWDDHFRVNVFIGADATSARIANSYFVKTDSDGKIVRSFPSITKLYEQGAR
jgi:hypothetical protein